MPYKQAVLNTIVEKVGEDLARATYVFPVTAGIMAPVRYEIGLEGTEKNDWADEKFYMTIDPKTQILMVKVPDESEEAFNMLDKEDPAIKLAQKLLDACENHPL